VQKIVATILLLAFFGQTFSQGFLYIDYLVHKAAYVKKCVNKARPQMHCNGKCQLMKKIEEREKKERGLPPEMKLSGKAEVLSSKSFYGTIDIFSISIRNSYFMRFVANPVDRAFSVFHPPQA
jgi:hypothetical protein